ncbi:MAG: TrkH family potassium uptake protein [Phycisphaerales bacterium]
MPTRELVNLKPLASFTPGVWARLVIAVLANAPTILMFGFREPPIPEGALLAAQIVLLGAYVVWGLWRIMRAPTPDARRRAFEEEGRIELIACALGVMVVALPGAPALAAAVFLGVHLVRILLLLIERGISAALVLVVSFASVIFTGAGMLMLPAATPEGQPIRFLDALFTSTSATCVTGLVVLDTPTAFTRFGHTVIMVLMQLGGLGILSFAALLLVAMGSSLGLRATSTLGDSSLETRQGPKGIRKMLASIVVLTFGLEAIGAVALFFGWPETWNNAPPIAAPGDRAFHSIFFAVSAFCNAGFATTPDSVESLRTHWTTHFVIAGLVVVGGIGFPALDNLRQVAFARLRGKRTKQGRLIRVALHTKLTLTTTFVVYLIGVVLIFVSEYFQRLDSVGLSLLDAHFMAIASRTAGFDVIHPAEMGPLSRFVLVVQMFIGGGPASTAGGIKTVATAVLVLTVIATLRGRSQTEVFKRTIPDALVRKAAVLITLGLATVAALIGTLSLTEKRGDTHLPLEEIVFESVSASATVGLSMGTTSTLSDPGRVAVIIAMYVGRLGPLAVLGALTSVRRTDRAQYAYPDEGVLMT